MFFQVGLKSEKKENPLIRMAGKIDFSLFTFHFSLEMLTFVTQTKTITL